MSSSKVDAKQKAKLEKTLKEAEEKLEKAKRDAGEVSCHILYLFVQ